MKLNRKVLRKMILKEMAIPTQQYQIKIMTDEGEEVFLGGPETEFDFQNYIIEIFQGETLLIELRISKSSTEYDFDIQSELEALIPGTEMYEYGSNFSVDYGQEYITSVLPAILNQIVHQWNNSV